MAGILILGSLDAVNVVVIGYDQQNCKTLMYGFFDCIAAQTKLVFAIAALFLVITLL